MKRFSMTFDNPGQNTFRQNYLSYQTQLQLQKQQQQQRPVALNRKADLTRPMVDRVYKAKPGCSACGK